MTTSSILADVCAALRHVVNSNTQRQQHEHNDDNHHQSATQSTSLMFLIGTEAAVVTRAAQLVAKEATAPVALRDERSCIVTTLFDSNELILSITAPSYENAVEVAATLSLAAPSAVVTLCISPLTPSMIEVASRLAEVCDAVSASNCCGADGATRIREIVVDGDSLDSVAQADFASCDPSALAERISSLSQLLVPLPPLSLILQVADESPTGIKLVIATTGSSQSNRNHSIAPLKRTVVSQLGTKAAEVDIEVAMRYVVEQVAAKCIVQEQEKEQHDDPEREHIETSSSSSSALVARFNRETASALRALVDSVSQSSDDSSSVSNSNSHKAATAAILNDVCDRVRRERIERNFVPKMERSVAARWKAATLLRLMSSLMEDVQTVSQVGAGID